MCFKILPLVLFKVSAVYFNFKKVYIVLEIGAQWVVDISLLCFVIHGFDNEPDKFSNTCGCFVKPHDRATL